MFLAKPLCRSLLENPAHVRFYLKSEPVALQIPSQLHLPSQQLAWLWQIYGGKVGEYKIGVEMNMRKSIWVNWECLGPETVSLCWKTQQEAETECA